MRNHFLVVLCLSAIFFIISALSAYSLIKKYPKDGVYQESDCGTLDLSGIIYPSFNTAIFEGRRVSLPALAFEDNYYSVLGVNNDSKWIEIDLSEQKLIAREGDNVFLETRISTGLPRTPTPTGEFRIWIKVRAARMVGGEGRYYYNLPNVPYIMYFANDKVPGYKGYGLHGAYWHNDFGTQRSHGCVNLPIPIAERLYYWTTPDLPDGKNTVKANGGNPGTKIVIHN